MEFRWHPILENLKVNEDGTTIIFNDEELRIKEYNLKHAKEASLYVKIKEKNCTVKRLVCECWHGLPPTRYSAARRVDQYATNHYSNLYWGKRGMTKQVAATSNRYDQQRKTAKISEELYKELVECAKNRKLGKRLAELGIGERSWRNAKNRYDKTKKSV